MARFSRSQSLTERGKGMATQMREDEGRCLEWAMMLRARARKEYDRQCLRGLSDYEIGREVISQLRKARAERESRA